MKTLDIFKIRGNEGDNHFLFLWKEVQFKFLDDNVT